MRKIMLLSLTVCCFHLDLCQTSISVCSRGTANKSSNSPDSATTKDSSAWPQSRCSNGATTMTSWFQLQRNQHGLSLGLCSIAQKNKVWGSWQPWSSCSASCGEGSKERSRPCVNPDQPYDCLEPCSGLSGSAVKCFKCCETLPSTWRAWSEWTTCVRAVSFRTENQSRGRSCRKLDLRDRPPGTCAEDCPGDSYETVKCPPTSICEDTWLAWGEYGPCSETCGAGVKTRSRRCRGTLCVCRGKANDTLFCTGSACQGGNVSSTPGSSDPTSRVAIVVGSLLLLLAMALGLAYTLTRRQRSATRSSAEPGVLESTDRRAEPYPASYPSSEEYPVPAGTLPRPPIPSPVLPQYDFPPAGSLDAQSARTHPAFQVSFSLADPSVTSDVDPGSESDFSSTRVSDGSNTDDVSSSVASSSH